jgi:hypothetical protein
MSLEIPTAASGWQVPFRKVGSAGHELECLPMTGIELRQLKEDGFILLPAVFSAAG